MADAIYEIPFGAQSRNQGYYGKKVVMRRPKYLILTPLDFRITPAQWQGDLASYLQDAATNDDPAQRIQILSDIQGAEPDNQESAPLEFPYGPSQRIYGDQYATVYTFGDIDLVKHQLRQNLNDAGGEMLVIIVDHDLQYIGTADEDGLMRGFTTAEIFENNTVMDSGTGAIQTMRIAYADSSEFNKGNLLVLPTKVNPGPANIKLVMDIHLKVIADLNTRVVTLAFMGAGNNFPLNLAERVAYRTILVSNPGLVNFTTAAGVPLTITSAAPAFVNGQHGITYTLSATGYPIAGQQIYVDMDAVSVVEAALGTPFETPETLILTV